VTRRAALCLPALLLGDERSDVLDAVTPLASALSNGDAEEFMRRIAEDFPNRSQLANYIQGLIAQAELTCSVRLVNVETDRAELDWLMDIRGRATQMILERRKGTVFVKVRRRTVVSLDPITFFKPVEVR
jgi:hypothetical protein